MTFRIVATHLQQASDIRPMGLSTTRDRLTWGQCVMLWIGWAFVFGMPLAYWVVLS